MFRAAYENAARKIDRSLVGTAPSRAQLHRWTSGALKRLPYTDHCRVLETMFPGWTSKQLFAPCPDDIPLEPSGPHADAVPGPADPPGAAPRVPSPPGSGAVGARHARAPDAPALPPPGGTVRAPAVHPSGFAPVDASATAYAPPAGGNAGAHGRAACGCRTWLADVAAVFTTRAEFTCAVPPQAMFDGARSVRAAGLSLNLLCQQYPDQRLRLLLDRGARLQCLFLDPDGEAIKAREREEGYTDRYLTTLTKLNIEVLSRVRDRLPSGARDRLSIAVYDETIRFGIVLVDDDTCVVQPYLPRARGVDSPTFLLHRSLDDNGLYATFDRVYCELWERSRAV